MRFGIAGDDPRLAEWATRIARHGDAVDCHYVDEPVPAGPGRESGGGGRPSLAPDEDCDAIVVGGSSESAAQTASRAAVRGPVLLVPDPAQSATSIYALELQTDSPERLVPALPWKTQPAVEMLQSRLAAGALGEIRLLRAERFAAQEEGQFSLPEIERWFLEDGDLMQSLGSGIDRVTAVLIGSSGETAREATVTLEADAEAQSVWRLVGSGAESFRLTVEGSRGVAELREANGVVSLLIDGQQVVEHPVESGCEILLDRFVARVTASGSSGAKEGPLPAWNDLLRAWSLCEGIRRSIRRRRTVEVHVDSLSERSQFKTQMTAVGCGVLLWTLFATIAALALGVAIDPRDPVERRAAQAETLLWHEDFHQGNRLLPESRERLEDRLAMAGAFEIVVIESTKNPELDQSRLNEVTAVAKSVAEEAALQQGGRVDPAVAAPAQVVVLEVAGRWFGRVMLGVWSIVFGPLVIFLLLQLLFVVTKEER